MKLFASRKRMAKGEHMNRLVYLSSDCLSDLDSFRVETSMQGVRADIVLDRPPFNVMSLSQHEQIRAVIEALDRDPVVQIIVLRSSREHFSNGMDAFGLSHAAMQNASKLVFALSAPSRCSKPVIAANRGHCFGSAFELSLACDFRVVTESTVYALPALHDGHLPGYESMRRLHRLIGTGRTKDLVMRSRFLDGVKAYNWGIANEFTVDTELENVTDALVEELLATSPAKPRAIKQFLNGIEGVSSGLEYGPDGELQTILA